MSVAVNKVAEFQGKDIFLFRMKNAHGHVLECINLGATITRISVFGKSNIVLAYPKYDDYFSDEFYLGCTVGRVANRISGGVFQLNGKTYELTKNDGKNTNHGGVNGFNKKIFNAEIQENKVVFSTVSKDGEEGFPGNVSVHVSYSFTDNDELIIDYETSTDKTTPVSLTNHSYINLSESNDIRNHNLKVNADFFLEMNQSFLPTGKIMKSADFPAFDFTQPAEIGEKIHLKNEPHLDGYNVYFPLEETKLLKKGAILNSPDSGIQLALYTSMPGFMLYTGDYLSHPFLPFQGVCLEAHHYPDAVNKQTFPAIWLEPGIARKERIVYALSRKERT